MAKRPGGRGLDAMYIFSGLTGRPKGTVVDDGALINYVMWAAQAYPSTSGVALLHSAAFDRPSRLCTGR